MPCRRLRTQSVRGTADSACRRGAPERHGALRPRPRDLGPGRELQGARSRQSLRRGRQLLPVERRGESGADDHGQRAARGRSPVGAAAVKRMLPAAVALLTLAAGARAQTTRAADRVTAREVGPIGLTVSDRDAEVRFFTAVLGFSLESDTELVGEPYERLEGVFGAHLLVARLVLGNEHLELTEYLAPRGRPYPGDSRSNDRWFQHVAIIVSDMDSAYRVLRAHKVGHISTVPQTIPLSNPAAGGIRAFYFHDPEGHPLELLWFPSGKGAERWHRSDRLFLGIA